jgi:5'-phosphate synthase pdxT subunit
VVGVLAIQGSFALHVQSLRRCGVEAREVRKPANLEGLRGLVVPGGESTVIALLTQKYGLTQPLCERARAGLPVFGTCAGAILLGRGEERPERWSLVDVEVERNAYGTQIESFCADVKLAPFREPFHCVFIRAPKFHVAGEAPGVEVLGRCGQDPVLLRSRNFLLAAFHPELTADLRVHQLFLEQCGVSTAAEMSAQSGGM